MSRSDFPSLAVRRAAGETGASIECGTGASADAAKAPVNPLTYPKSAEPFSHKLFRSPSAEYRGCPLWAWNTKLDAGQLKRQIQNFKDMGMGGFHMHVRVGLDTEYMGPEFMDLVRTCVEEAESKGLLACLYDDDRWPSGAAGGLLLKQYPEHKGKHLLFTPYAYGESNNVGGEAPASARATRSENGYLLATYDIDLDSDGRLKSSRRIGHAKDARHDVWYAYVETNPGSAWFNGQTYVDTMAKDAMSRFIDMTYETYKAKVGDKFGTTVPCVFTDEPQFATKTRLSNPHAKEDIFLPWTTGLPKSFNDEYGADADLIRDLPELVWHLPDGKPSVARYHYHNHVCELFVGSFMDQLSSWCGANNIMLDGHMMEEPTLASQSAAIGEAMRCYRNMQMPGMDLLSDALEYNTAKQVSSVARQNGLRGAMSEIYGCTHWDFTFEGHKGCGDWQAALGITFRVHHLSWVSMAGEGKRDYPASIGYQSPWYKEYGYVESHFARVGYAMTRGRAVTRVAVVHPIESYWVCFGASGGPENQEMERRDRAFGDLTSWLLHGLLDFDFVAESLLPGQWGGAKGGQLCVGECRYEVLILPNLYTIRSSTLAIVKDFASAGGKVIIAGTAPELIDGRAPESEGDLRIPGAISMGWSKWNKADILGVLESYRDVRAWAPTASGGWQPCEEGFLYQMREDGSERYLFVCYDPRHGAGPELPPDKPFVAVSVKGIWEVEFLDTLTGKISRAVTRYGAKNTFIRFEKLARCRSILLRLRPLERDPSWVAVPNPVTPTGPTRGEAEKLSVALTDVVLSEPNVLMLDYATYRVNSGAWQSAREVLQIDNDIRAQFRMPQRSANWRQPWTVSAEERKPKAAVTLRFDFESEIDLDSDARLAMEIQGNTKDLVVNGTQLVITSPESPAHPSWWVDEAITTIPIPGSSTSCASPSSSIRKGTNNVETTFPFGVLTNIERAYILGRFKVQLDGSKAVIQRWPAASRQPALTWGDITSQGLPFYVGNVRYRVVFRLPARGRATLAVPEFESPVLTVSESASGKKVGVIALRPRELYLGVLGPGTHSYDIAAFGNRFNAFGHVHLPGWTGGCNPGLWRSEGWSWSDSYQLKPIGILSAPHVSFTPVDDDTEDGDFGSEETGHQDDNGYSNTEPLSPSPWVMVDEEGEVEELNE